MKAHELCFDRRDNLRVRWRRGREGIDVLLLMVGNASPVLNASMRDSPAADRAHRIRARLFLAFE